MQDKDKFTVLQFKAIPGDNLTRSLSREELVAWLIKHGPKKARSIRHHNAKLLDGGEMLALWKEVDRAKKP